MRQKPKTKKRSVSRKRAYRNESKTRDEDDLLVNLLNQRAASDREILITRDQYEELLSFKKNFRDLKGKNKPSTKELTMLQQDNAQLEKEKIRLQEELSAFKRQRAMDLETIKELRLSYTRDEIKDDQSMSLIKLRNSLGELDALVNYRASAARRHLHRCNKLIAGHAKLLLDQNMNTGVKSQLTHTIKEISQCLESVMNLLVNDKVPESAQVESTSYVKQIEAENSQLKDEIAQLKEQEEIVHYYRNALENMKQQTQVLRDRLAEIEGGGNLKSIIAEQENKIHFLENEKLLLSEHISTLQTSLREQLAVIEHLKSVISTFTNYTPSKIEAPKSSPKKYERQSQDHSPKEDFDTRIEKIYLEKEHEKDLKAEIACLDYEIQQLQNSLHRALTTY